MTGKLPSVVRHAAIDRVLKSAKLDWHDLAAQIAAESCSTTRGAVGHSRGFPSGLSRKS